MAASDPHLIERSERASRIIANPRKYKVCEGCDSIVARRGALCPHCNSYRFDDDEATIVAHARLLASRAQTSVSLEDLL